MIAYHDRDGHLCRPYPQYVPNWETLTPYQRGNPLYIKAPDQQQILPGIKQLLSTYKYNFVVSNQRWHSGEKTIEDVVMEARWLMYQLPLNGFGFCYDSGETAWLLESPDSPPILLSLLYPHLIGTFRKPQAGMIKALQLHYNILPETPQILIGDRLTDQACAIAASIDFQWSDVARGYPDPATRN